MKGLGPALDGGSGVGVGVGTPLFQTVHLPAQVTEVSKDVVRAFSHNKRVGTYLLGRSLGEGSFAKVKEALHLPTGEKVAVKVIDKKRAKADPYVRKNLRREGRLLQQVRHPHVVQLLEVLETEHSYYLVTEYCAGGDLMDYIGKKKKLDEREVKKFIRQIVSAVDYLHRLGIIHRDLKIENLLLDQNKDIKLIDFGLSNTVKVSTAPEGTPHAQEYLVTQCGSPAYAAPELLNHRKYGLQVDVWSIGVNMYAMLTGSLPFTVDPFNLKTLHNKMISGQMNPVPEVLSREGKDILRRFLTADPEKRLTIGEALRHPWLCEGRNRPVERHPFPNKLKTGELDIDILKHMSDNLGFRMSEIIRFVVGNVPSSACSTYHLYYRKLQRHRAEQRSQGKSPVDTKHVQPTRISLVLQDMTPRVLNGSVPPTRPPLRTRGDSVEEATQGPNGRRMSLEKARTTMTTPSTDKDSGKERTFLSSLEHSLEDVTSRENRDRKSNQSSSKQPEASSATPAKATTTTTTTAAAAAPAPAGHVAKTSVKVPHVYTAVNHHPHGAGRTGGGKASSIKTTATTPTTTTSMPLGIHTTAATSTAVPHPNQPHHHHHYHHHHHHVVTSDNGGRSSSNSKPGVVGGRTLVPLNRTFVPLRKAGGGGGVVVRGKMLAGAVLHQDLHHQHPPTPTASSAQHPGKNAANGSTTNRGGGLLRATYPAGGSALVTAGQSSSSSSTPTPNPTPGNNAGPAASTTISSSSSRQPPVIKRAANAVHWRSAAAQHRLTLEAAAPEHLDASRLQAPGAGHRDFPSSSSSSTTITKTSPASPDAHSKRPVSPQALPLVRRRLAKRSRQEDQGHLPEMGHGAGDEGDTGAGAGAGVEVGVEESVTMERLVTSPDGFRMTRTSVVSQSLGASSSVTTPRGDLQHHHHQQHQQQQQQHTLPAIPSNPVTPRPN